MKSRALALAALFVVAGCGGGGGSSPAPSNPPTNTNAGQKQTMNMVVIIPLAATKASAKLKQPKYVSPNTTQIRVQVNSVNSGPPPSWVATDTTTAVSTSGASPACITNGPNSLKCTIPVAAPPGTVNYTITAEDAVPNALARVTQDVTITQGTTNNPTLTLLGVVATVNILLPAITANASQSATPVTWSALDASGALIVGTFDNAVTVKDNDGTGQTTLHVNGGSANVQQTLAAAGDSLTIDYTGQADNPFSVTASGTGITGSGSVTPGVFDVTFTGTTLDDTGHGGKSTDPNWSEPTLFFSQASGSQSVDGAEVGWTNAPFNQQFDLDAGPNTSPWCTFYGNSIATFSASPATTFTITATGVGQCKVRLKEHGTGYPITTHSAPGSPTDTTHDGTFWVSVTAANFTVNGKQRHN